MNTEFWAGEEVRVKSQPDSFPALKRWFHRSGPHARPLRQRHSGPVRAEASVDRRLRGSPQGSPSVDLAMTKGNPQDMTASETPQGGRRAPASPQGVSPYATGGGGVTFERQVAAKYLAHMLAGDGAGELGDGRRVVKRSVPTRPGPSCRRSGRECGVLGRVAAILGACRRRASVAQTRSERRINAEAIPGIRPSFGRYTQGRAGTSLGLGCRGRSATCSATRTVGEPRPGPIGCTRLL